MSDVMELEARLKNLISGEMQNIVKSIEDVTKKNTESSKEQVETNKVTRGSVDDLSDSWNIAKISATSFISAMGAMAILNTVKNQLIAVRNETKAYIETQLQQKAALGFTSVALNNQADVLMKLYTVNDELVRSVQTRIAFFTKDEEKIKKLTQATFDFAAATGMDAASAALLLGKSIENGGALLGRYGLKIKETSDSMERIDLIIEKVNQRFGGQAIALAQSKDMWDKLKLSIDETHEAIGLLFKSKFWKGEMENSGTEYTAFMEYNYKHAQELLVRADATSGLFTDMQIKRAKAIIEAYNQDPEIKSINTTKLKTFIQQKFDLQQKDLQETERIQNEALKLTTDGQITLLNNLRKIELDKTKDTDEGTKQRLLINEIYNSKISELQNKSAEESINIQKKAADFYERTLDLHNKTYEEDVKFSIEAMKLLYEASEADIKANNDHAASQEKNISIIMNRKLKAKEQEKKDVDELKKKDDDARKSKIENTQLIADSSIGTLKNFAKASKSSSALQKTLDIAQASANTAIAVSKALTPGLQWQIPFIIALGASQIALIASQKYEYGGIVKGNKTSGDQVPAMVNSREMILTLGQQENLFSMLSRPNQINNSSSNQNSTNSNTTIHLNINVGNNGNYDMSAARYTVDQLTPIIGDALIKAKNEGRLRQYENSR